MPPSCPTTAVARGTVGLEVRLGRPTLLDCHLVQVVSLVSWGQLPKARVCHPGSWRGPQAHKALPCPGNLPEMTWLRCYCPRGEDDPKPFSKPFVGW